MTYTYWKMTYDFGAFLFFRYIPVARAIPAIRSTAMSSEITTAAVSPGVRM